MNLSMLLEMAADEFGDRVLIGGREDGLTATELRRAALRGAALAAEAGANAIVYLTSNGPAFPVALFAAAYAGVPLVPLDERLSAERLDALFAQQPGTLTIADHRLEAAVGKHDTTVLSAEEWVAATVGGVEPESTFVESDTPAVVVYTSGTTSAPKPVLLRHAHLTAYVLGSVQLGSAAADEAELVSMPAWEVAAVTHLVRNVFAGRRSLLLEHLEPAQWLGTVRAEEVTSALLLPPMLARIVEAAGDKAAPSLRTLEYGGAPMPAAVIQRARATWPSLDFLNEYWLAETSSTVARLTPADYRGAFGSPDPFVRARLGSVGRAVPGVEIQIRDAQDQVLAPGERGRIWIRGEQVSAEYAGIGRLLDADGFFDTRDEGFLDEDGYLFLDGRRDDTILRGDMAIAPSEIESVLHRHPAVADAAVVGVPGGAAGQQVVAVVVPAKDSGATPEELQRFLRGRLRSDRTPDQIAFWSHLPRTAAGKLVRRTVVERFCAERV